MQSCLVVWVGLGQSSEGVNTYCIVTFFRE